MVIISWGIILAVIGPLLWMGTSILLQGNLSGLIIPASGLLFAAWIYNSVAGPYLWMDAESVGVSRPLAERHLSEERARLSLGGQPGF